MAAFAELCFAHRCYAWEGCAVLPNAVLGGSHRALWSVQSCSTLCDPIDYSMPASCPSPTLGTCSNSCPSSWWCHPTISSSVVPFSSRLQSFPVSGSFSISQLFTRGGQSIRASALVSILPTNIQGWFPTGFIILLSKRLLRLFSNTTVQKNPFLGAQSSL